MGIKKDLTGKRFTKILVLNEAGRNKHGGIIWNCKCDCGIEKQICGDNLKCGQTISCGCLNRENIAKRNLSHGYSIRGHIMPEYSAWSNMISRCYNPKDQRFDTYGARGITVCDEWRNSFSAFINDMGNRPSKNHSLDRGNNDLGYCKENCRWATEPQQQRNKTTNHWIEYDGRKQILQEWAKELKTGHTNIILMLKKKSFNDVYAYYKNKKL